MQLSELPVLHLPLPSWQVAGAYLAALLLTLVLACWLTPARWWRRPNARALLVLAGGTWAIASLILWQAPGRPAPALAVIPAPALGLAAAPAPALSPDARAPAVGYGAPGSFAMTALAGQPYRVHHDLNLRSGASVSAPRLGVVPLGATVHPTGARQGDWWQIRASVAGRDSVGWASSLWLRRADDKLAH